ncbi:hypothetical protein ACJ72_07577 [Emergomyces africanus]|uniref:RING-type domain-containing protein n=1 Tax=Emergomyces africanus TaxID=1955775 RepID=A0A1B7NNB4_9EURO|nr:hypothetical protein ACJ72_07577 [Emergomyces africanus]
MDLESLSPSLRRSLAIRVENPLSADEATFFQENELCELFGIFPQSADFTCLGQASASGARCRGKISREQRCIATTLLAGANRTFPYMCANMHEVTEKLERIARHLLCQRNHRKQTSNVARSWLLKLVQYRVLECDMRWARLESMLDPLVMRFNHIGAQLRADGRISLEVLDARRIQADELSLGANNDAAEQTVAVVDVFVDAETGADVDSEPAQGGDGPVSTPHPPAAHPQLLQVDRLINHAGSTRSLQRTEARREGEEEEEQKDETTRMPIEGGDCPICQESLINTAVIASLASSSSNSPYESDELSYCSRLCGRNFHVACINSWINTCIRSGWNLTCPNWYVFDFDSIALLSHFCVAQSGLPFLLH